MIRSTMRAAALLCLAMSSASAFAQESEPVDDGSDNFTIGAGAVYTPSYEGSDDYVISPAVQLRGRVSGFSFYTRGTSIYLDLIREKPGAAWDFFLGPAANVRFNRTGRIEDPQVKALGELDTAIELGGAVGATKNGVFHDYDFLTFRLDAIHDVTNTHDSMIFTPAIEYATPLSRTFLVGASVSADHVGDGFAQTYFGVTPAGAAASGLAPYSLKGGFKNVRASLLLTQSLSGDLRRGWALFALGSYSRLLGDFKRSPIVADAGDADQFLIGGGIGYTF